MGKFDDLRKEAEALQATVVELTSDFVALPGFIDAHTHICFAGTRARDYALRNAGKTYLEIAQAGGGIWDSVQQKSWAAPMKRPLRPRLSSRHWGCWAAVAIR